MEVSLETINASLTFQPPPPPPNNLSQRTCISMPSTRTKGTKQMKGAWLRKKKQSQRWLKQKQMGQQEQGETPQGQKWDAVDVARLLRVHMWLWILFACILTGAGGVGRV